MGDRCDHHSLRVSGTSSHHIFDRGSHRCVFVKTLIRASLRGLFRGSRPRRRQVTHSVRLAARLLQLLLLLEMVLRLLHHRLLLLLRNEHHVLWQCIDTHLGVDLAWNAAFEAFKDDRGGSHRHHIFFL